MSGTARELWVGFETIHAITYFHPTCLDAFTAAGTKGFWMGYFAGRLAPMGAVGPDVATAVCFGFSPTRAARALPDAWDRVNPAQMCEVRAAAAATALREIVPAIDTAVAPLVAPLDALCAGLVAAGRPLGAANRGVARPVDPVARVWQSCTELREHRGDGHVAAWVAHGLDGLGSNVLSCAVTDRDPEDTRPSRDWSPEQWAGAADALAARALVEVGVDGTVVATARGRALHAEVEATTDDLAAASYAGMAATDLRSLGDALGSIAAVVAASGAVRYPNPIGLPAA